MARRNIFFDMEKQGVLGSAHRKILKTLVRGTMAPRFKRIVPVNSVDTFVGLMDLKNHGIVTLNLPPRNYVRVLRGEEERIPAPLEARIDVPRPNPPFSDEQIRHVDFARPEYLKQARDYLLRRIVKAKKK